MFFLLFLSFSYSILSFFCFLQSFSFFRLTLLSFRSFFLLSSHPFLSFVRFSVSRFPLFVLWVLVLCFLRFAYFLPIALLRSSPFSFLICYSGFLLACFLFIAYCFLYPDPILFFFLSIAFLS